MRRSLAFASAAVAACAAAAPLHAQGSSVDQHSACMAGRVGAGVAAPCEDASAVYFSPAGLALTPSAVGINVALIRAGGTFTYDPAVAPARARIEREAETIPVPAVFANVRVTPRVAVGLGVFAPYGLGLAWPVCSVEDPRCDGQNFEGRFTGYDQQLRSIYIQPTVAFQLIPGRVAVGAGVDYVIGSIDVHQRVSGPAALGLAGTDIADAFLSGEGTGLTGHVGAVVQLSPRTSVGVRYLHSVKVEMDGDADFTQVLTGVTPVDATIAAQFTGNGPLVDQSVATEIEFPWQFVAGVSHRATERLNLLFDWQRTGWESFDAFELEFGGGRRDTLSLGYQNTNTFRFAAEYGVSEALELRAGFRYNNAATPRATPFLPEGERNYFTAGLGYRVTPRLAADLAFQYINQPDRRGNVIPETEPVGVYGSTGQVFGFTLSYRFGGGGTQ